MISNENRLEKKPNFSPQLDRNYFQTLRISSASKNVPKLSKNILLQRRNEVELFSSELSRKNATQINQKTKEIEKKNVENLKFSNDSTPKIINKKPEAFRDKNLKNCKKPTINKNDLSPSGDNLAFVVNYKKGRSRLRLNSEKMPTLIEKPIEEMWEELKTLTNNLFKMRYSMKFTIPKKEVEDHLKIIQKLL